MSLANRKVVQQLSQAWPKRATVCSMSDVQALPDFEASRYDYPIQLVPFFEHPRFQCLDDDVQRLAVTWGWMGYNQRTITAEDCVVNPALLYIATDLLGPEDWDFQEAIRQTLIDEHYHSLMHLRSMERTRQQRKLTRSLNLPPSITYRRLQELQARLAEPWEKALAAVAFATVAEISVNAFLDILAEDQSIQPANCWIAKMHNRDEYAHSKTLAEVSKILFHRLEPAQQGFFVEVLPQALAAYVAQDYSMWEAILCGLDVPQYQSIVADCACEKSSKVLTRDYTGLYEFAADVGIVDQLDFDFGDTLRNPRVRQKGAPA